MVDKETQRRKDSLEFISRKSYYRQFLTVYGRNIILEALESPDVQVAKLHIAERVKGKNVQRILSLAEAQGVEINRTTPEKVTRISRNGRQDQGMAADLRLPGYCDLSNFLSTNSLPSVLFALDGITTPSNVGMIIRSSLAGGVGGIIIPERGCCAINPMVIKASAGTVFKANIMRTERIMTGLKICIENGYSICALEGGASESLFEFVPNERTVYVFGGEGEGVSNAVIDIADSKLMIPMAAGIESLNVAVAASIVAYREGLVSRVQ